MGTCLLSKMTGQTFPRPEALGKAFKYRKKNEEKREVGEGINFTPFFTPYTLDYEEVFAVLGNQFVSINVSQ